MLCYIILSYVMLCYVTLCYVMVCYTQMYRTRLKQWVTADRSRGDNVVANGGCWDGAYTVPRVRFDNGRVELLLPVMLQGEVVGQGVCCRLQALVFPLCVHGTPCTFVRATLYVIMLYCMLLCFTLWYACFVVLRCP